MPVQQVADLVSIVFGTATIVAVIVAAVLEYRRDRAEQQAELAADEQWRRQLAPGWREDVTIYRQPDGTERRVAVPRRRPGSRARVR